MQNGIPNTVETGAFNARDLISKSNANGNTMNQGSHLTPENTASTAEHAAPQGQENTQLTPASNVVPNGGPQPDLTLGQPASNTLVPGQNPSQEQTLVVETPSQSELVLAGKYRKEVPELNRKNKMNESTIEILQSKSANQEKEIQDLKQMIATAQPNEGQQQDGVSVPNDPKSLMDALNPDDFQVYGDEFVNFAKIMKNSFTQIQSQTRPQEPPPAQNSERAPEQKKYDNILFAAIGENTFHDINRDSRFVNGFLDQINPETSRYYRSDLMESHENMDPALVIKIFKAFIDSLGGQYTPIPQHDPNLTQGNVTQNPAPPLGNINNASPAPNMSASNTMMTPNTMNTNAETFTQDQVDSFYKSITPGVGEFAGTAHKEWATNMKTKILAAYNSGRVTKNIQ